MDGERLDEDQIALVLRRATELDSQSAAVEPGLDLEVLEAAAVEAGLSRESVRRAVAELRAGTLSHDSGLPTRRVALGAGSLTLARCVPGPRRQVDELLRRFLAKEQFHLRRDFGATSTWVRRQDVGARVRIQYDKSIQRRLLLRDAEQVELAVVEEPGDAGMVMVRLAVDMPALRRAHGQAVGKGLGVGIAVASAGALLGLPEALLVVPTATVGGAAVGHRVGLSRYRSAVSMLETAVEGFLDGVERRAR